MLCKYGLRGTLGEGLSYSELEGETVAVFVFVEDSKGGALGVDSEEYSEAGDEEGDGAGEALGWDARFHCRHRGVHSTRER